MIAPWLLRLWRWLGECAEPGCTGRPVSLGWCEIHEKPYDHEDEFWGPKEETPLKRSGIVPLAEVYTALPLSTIDKVGGTPAVVLTTEGAWRGLVSGQGVEQRTGYISAADRHDLPVLALQAEPTEEGLERLLDEAARVWKETRRGSTDVGLSDEFRLLVLPPRRIGELWAGYRPKQLTHREELAAAARERDERIARQADARDRVQAMIADLGAPPVKATGAWRGGVQWPELSWPELEELLLAFQKQD